MSKQKQIDRNLYSIIKEIHSSAIHFSEDDVKCFLVEQGYICDRLEEEMIRINKCPRCASNLVVKTVGQETYEYQGFETSEPIYQLQCSDCGLVVD